MLIAVSTLVLIIIATGFTFRHQRKTHIPCMLTAFAIDLGLVLYIELTRHAIKSVSQAVQHPLPHGLLLFHVTMSVFVLILYVVMLSLGVQLLKGQETKRISHRNLGYTFILCRLANYATSFFVAGSQ
jgi:uncharacterized membrane protein YozB (DUF420 family)